MTMRPVHVALAAALLAVPAAFTAGAYALTCSPQRLVCADGDHFGHTHWCQNYGTTQRQCEVHWHGYGSASANTGVKGEQVLTDSGPGGYTATDSCSVTSGSCSLGTEVEYVQTFPKGGTQSRCASMTTTGKTLNVVTVAEVEVVECISFS